MKSEILILKKLLNEIVSQSDHIKRLITLTSDYIKWLYCINPRGSNLKHIIFRILRSRCKLFESYCFGYLPYLEIQILFNNSISNFKFKNYIISIWSMVTNMSSDEISSD